ncbi:uncharacterized protein LOC112525838 isoform X1 [Cynara cardunculus var. scolymus]|uniref:uncharacterized protein LOC112525838 isoform X1 n=1 Tax=Cynara cardunculus var. scolymus TaxID=59895 RepID=UPI000D62FC08|nr:uncharacterized protein LOC112525838 isoform X1 [Cynara cardunculus var. scolymus]
MLAGVISSRPKYWLLGSPLAHYASAARHRHIPSDASFPIKLLVPTTDCLDRRRFPYHSTAARLNFSASGISASLWHAILPAGNGHNLTPAGEGSWNVAWDVRPARWLHRPHTAWLLFGICACLAAPPIEFNDSSSEPVVADDNKINGNCTTTISENSTNYRITVRSIAGVPADGRCLFRAIAHMVCLRNGEEAPDENRQRELADELRAQVVDELLKRRKEIEWFIEGDFDTYVKRIQKPYVWGGEPELLMASHLLKTTIYVFMLERSSDKLLNIATYGKEYQQEEKSSIKVLFHGLIGELPLYVGSLHRRIQVVGWFCIFV